MPQAPLPWFLKLWPSLGLERRSVAAALTAIQALLLLDFAARWHAGFAFLWAGQWWLHAGGFLLCAQLVWVGVTSHARHAWLALPCGVLLGGVASGLAAAGSGNARFAWQTAEVFDNFFSFHSSPNCTWGDVWWDGGAWGAVLGAFAGRTLLRAQAANHRRPVLFALERLLGALGLAALWLLPLVHAQAALCSGFPGADDSVHSAGQGALVGMMWCVAAAGLAAWFGLRSLRVDWLRAVRAGRVADFVVQRSTPNDQALPVLDEALFAGLEEVLIWRGDAQHSRVGLLPAPSASHASQGDPF